MTVTIVLCFDSGRCLSLPNPGLVHISHLRDADLYSGDAGHLLVLWSGPLLLRSQNDARIHSVPGVEDILGWNHPQYYDSEYVRRKYALFSCCICYFFIPELCLYASLKIILFYGLASFENPTYGDYIYPAWVAAFGWCVAMISCIPIPFFIVKRLVTSKGNLLQV